jgi:hypothetical protein
MLFFWLMIVSLVLGGLTGGLCLAEALRGPGLAMNRVLLRWTRSGVTRRGISFRRRSLTLRSPPRSTPARWCPGGTLPLGDMPISGCGSRSAKIIPV